MIERCGSVFEQSTMLATKFGVGRTISMAKKIANPSRICIQRLIIFERGTRGEEKAKVSALLYRTFIQAVGEVKISRNTCER